MFPFYFIIPTGIQIVCYFHLKNNKNKTSITYNPLQKLHFLAPFCSKKNPQRSCQTILWSMSLSTLFFLSFLVSTHFLCSLFFMDSWIQLDFHPHSNWNSSYRDYQSTNSLLPNKSPFLLFVVVMFHQVTLYTELTNSKPLLPGKIHGQLPANLGTFL